MTPRIANLSTFASRSTKPSALPSNLRMPHVFVIPPEEEQQDNPPWCCFDADEHPHSSGSSPSNPDIHFLDVPYLLQQPEQDVPVPIAHTSGQQPRTRPPVLKKLEKKQRPEAIKIIENKPSHARKRDSDVIEVVKVKRSREAFADLEENTKVKRSRTLKARATKALQSIKNVGKNPHRSHVKDLWTSSESMPGIFKGVQEQIRSQYDQTGQVIPTKKGSISRGSSRSLSQIFQPIKASRPESSLILRGMSSVASGEAPDVPPAANPSSLSHPGCNNTSPTLDEIPSTLTIDDALDRPVSPTRMKKNSKFSVRELHRLFSFSSSSPDNLSSTPRSSACSGSMPSTSTSTLFNYPDVPLEEDIFADAHFLDLENMDRKPASRSLHTNHDDNLSTPRRLSDLSFEMKLDSLHFDALSFDPEDFDIPKDGNVLR